MTDHSNAITNLINKYTAYCECEEWHIHDGVDKNADPNDGCRDFDEEIFQLALYEAVVASLPEKDMVGNDDAIVNALAEGHNNCVDTVLTNLRALFGVDVGSSQDQKQLKAQGHEADNLNEEANQ